MLALYLAVLITALYWVSKILGPEMAKSPLSKTDPDSDSRIFTQTNESDKRIAKLEILLAEKNKNINLLEKELRFFHVQVHAFDKVKTLMDEEIHRLRQQNRIFRSELGIPPIASSSEHKENLIT